MLTDAILKTQALDVMISTLTESVINAVQKPETNTHLGLLATRVMQNEEVLNEAKNSLVYSNLAQRVNLASKPVASDSYKLSEALEQRIDTWFQDRNTL